jgi:hypothetical protein
VHADPLIWTVSRPLTTEVGFADHSTGIMLYGSLPFAERYWEYQLYFDRGSDLDPSPGSPSAAGILDSGLEIGVFDQAIGGRLIAHSDDDLSQIGFSLANFSAPTLAHDRIILGADFLYSPGALELSGELVYRRESRNNSKDLFGFFLQGVYEFMPGWHAVGRYEHFEKPDIEENIDVLSIGAAYKPRPPIILKLELLGGEENQLLAPDGLFASFGVLF